MTPILIARLKASARYVAEAGQALTNAADSLNALASALEEDLGVGAPGETAPPVYKKPNGRLTDAGVIKVQTLILAGKTDNEIADELQVHHTSILKRRRLFKSQNAV